VACQTRLSLPPAANLDSLIQSFASTTSDVDEPIAITTHVSNTSMNLSQIRRRLFTDEEDLFDETTPISEWPHRSSSPHQQQARGQPVSPDCSPIPLKDSISSALSSPSITPQSTLSEKTNKGGLPENISELMLNSIYRSNHGLSYVSSSSFSNMSIDSPLIHPPQMPSSSRHIDEQHAIEHLLISGEYARQVLENALADLMECSM
jgi:hypothetical protein